MAELTAPLDRAMSQHTCSDTVFYSSTASSTLLPGTLLHIYTSMHHTTAHNVHTYTLPQPPSSFCGSSLPSMLHAAPLSECASARGVRRAHHRQWAIAPAALAVTPVPQAPGRHRTQNKTYPSRPRANPTSMWRATQNAIAKSRTRQGGIYSPIAM